MRFQEVMRRDSGATRFLIEKVNNGLLFWEVDTVLLVFAEHFKDVRVGHKLVGDLDGKRSGVKLGIVKCHFPIQVSEVAAAEAFRDAQRVAMRMAHRIENGSIVEAGGLYHERVALPVPDRVSEEGREVKLLRKRAAIGEDLAMQVAEFIKDHGQPRRLHALDGFGEETSDGDAGDAHTNDCGVIPDFAPAHNLPAAVPSPPF